MDLSGILRRPRLWAYPAPPAARSQLSGADRSEWISNHGRKRPRRQGGKGIWRERYSAPILKLGVWARTQIERGTTVGNDVASAFAGHEARRVKRRIERRQEGPLPDAMEWPYATQAFPPKSSQAST